MPREIVHWSVLHETRSLLRRETPLIVDILDHYSAAAELGAMSHDAPYYLNRGHSDFHSVARFLHGSAGEDTFVPLRMLASRVGALPRDERRLTGWAFLFGMITHAITDSIFHPAVYFLTGNYDDPDPALRSESRRRHRLFETYLDLYIEGTVAPMFSPFLIDRVRHLDNTLWTPKESALSLCCSLLSESVVPPATPYSPAERERLWRSALTEMAFGQQLFRSSTVGGLLRIVAPFSSSLRELDALFSFGRNGSLRVFANPITYRNPLNGEKTTTTILERLQFATQRSAAVLARLEPHIDADAVTIERALHDIVGASLDLGLPKVPTAGLTHFSSDGFPLPGLRKPVQSST